MSSEKPIATHTLENGLNLEITDESRRMGADRWLVRLVMRMAFQVSDHYHEPAATGEPDRDELIGVIGPRAVYEAVRERLFVEDRAKQDVINDVCNMFLQDVVPYLGRPVFPRRYVVKLYRDKIARRRG